MRSSPGAGDRGAGRAVAASPGRRSRGGRRAGPRRTGRPGGRAERGPPGDPAAGVHRAQAWPDGTPLHLRWGAFTTGGTAGARAAFTAVPGERLSVRAEMGLRGFGLRSHRYDDVTEPDADARLGAGGLISVDLESGIIFDFFLTHSRLYAVYERLALRPDAEFAAFTYCVPVADRTPARSTGSRSDTTSRPAPPTGRPTGRRSCPWTGSASAHWTRAGSGGTTAAARRPYGRADSASASGSSWSATSARGAAVGAKAVGAHLARRLPRLVTTTNERHCDAR